ncbi:MAG: hypothetical protein H0W88_12305 [Parachlamydiaceae bacterium]|nr:hypothetical protein [Parachlamydiaceae bacterium]
MSIQPPNGNYSSMISKAVSSQETDKSKTPEKHTSTLLNALEKQISDLTSSNYALDPSLMQDLKNLQNLQASKIEKLMESLKTSDEEYQAVDTIADGTGALIGYSELIIQEVESGFQYVSKLYPKEIMNDSLLMPNFGKLEEGLALGESLLKALNLGLFGFALIYKAKILEQSTKWLKEAKLAYKDKEIPKNILEWEIQIHEQQKILNRSCIDYGLDLTHNAIALAKYPLELFAHISPVSQTFISLLGPAGAALGAVAAGLDYKHSKHMSKVHQAWFKQFQNWDQQTHISPKVSSKNFTKAPTAVSVKIQKLYTPPKDYKNEIETFIFNKKNNLQSIKSHLKSFNITLPKTITTKFQLIENWYLPSFQNPIVGQYSAYQQSLLDLHFISETSQNLLEKREAKMELKLIQLRKQKDLVPKLQEFIKKQSGSKIIRESLFPQFTKEFDKLLKKARTNTIEETQEQLKAIGLSLPNNIHTKQDANEYLNRIRGHELEFSSLFKQWIFSEPREALLKAYIDYQETIAITAKSALKQIVEVKHSINSKFLSMNIFRSKMLLTIAVVTLGAFVVLGSLAFGGIPLIGAALLFLYISIPVGGISGGLMGMGLYMNLKYQPSVFNPDQHLDTIAYTVTSLYTGIQNYRNLSKHKKMQDTLKIIQELHSKPHLDKNSPEYQKSYRQYIKAKADFEESLHKAEEWSAKTDKIAHRMSKRSWIDFANASKLSVRIDPESFNTMNSLKEALKTCDFSILDQETKTFFEVQLGINLQELQEKLKEDPDVIEKTLLRFFTYSEESMTSFIENQEERIKAGLLPSH